MRKLFRESRFSGQVICHQNSLDEKGHKALKNDDTMGDATAEIDLPSIF